MDLSNLPIITLNEQTNYRLMEIGQIKDFLPRNKRPTNFS